MYVVHCLELGTRLASVGAGGYRFVLSSLVAFPSSV